MPRIAIITIIAALSCAAPLAALSDTTRFGLDGYSGATILERPDTGFQPVTHEFDMRFGVVYSSDKGMEPAYGARYRVTFNHQMDNGWQFGLSLGASLDNMNRSAHWREQRGSVIN